MPESKMVGTISVELLCRVGDGEPESFGFVQVPLTVHNISTSTLQAQLSAAVGYVRSDLAAVFGTSREDEQRGEG